MEEYVRPTAEDAAERFLIEHRGNHRKAYIAALQASQRALVRGDTDASLWLTNIAGVLGEWERKAKEEKQ
jgi:hypothetical protein